MPIFDQGYQHWDGTLSGHGWRWLAIARAGIKVQARNRWTRIVTLLAMMPAGGLVILLALWGMLVQKPEMVTPLFQALGFPPELVSQPRTFTPIVWTLAYHYFFTIQLYGAMLLVLLVGPGLISQDLRFNALPLYFSRPLSRADYFVGKLGVIGFYLALVAIVPAVLAYLLGVALSFDLEVLRQTVGLLLGSVAYGLVIVVSAGTLMLALSALTRSSRYVGGMWVGLWIVSASVALVLSQIHAQSVYREAWDSARREEASSRRAPTAEPVTQEDWERRQQEQMEYYARQQAGYQRAWRARQEAARQDWRPMLSYTGCLQRVGSALLGTDEAWQEVDDTFSRRDPGRIVNEMGGPGYPWYWAAGVLLALFGLSLWILNMRVRSLDRLK